MAVALPVATKLVQDNQDNRNKAAGHCEYDDDCGSYGDYRCLEGECVKNAAPSGCSKDSDCPNGKTCMLGYCVTGTQTDECTKDSECNDDEHCIFSGGSDKCIKCTTFTYGACGENSCASNEKPKKCGDNYLGCEASTNCCIGEGGVIASGMGDCCPSLVKTDCSGSGSGAHCYCRKAVQNPTATPAFRSCVSWEWVNNVCTSRNYQKASNLACDPSNCTINDPTPRPSLPPGRVTAIPTIIGTNSAFSGGQGADCVLTQGSNGKYKKCSEYCFGGKYFYNSNDNSYQCGVDLKVQPTPADESCSRDGGRSNGCPCIHKGLLKLNPNDLCASGNCVSDVCVPAVIPNGGYWSNGCPEKWSSIGALCVAKCAGPWIYLETSLCISKCEYEALQICKGKWTPDGDCTDLYNRRDNCSCLVSPQCASKNCVGGTCVAAPVVTPNAGCGYQNESCALSVPRGSGLKNCSEYCCNSRFYKTNSGGYKCGQNYESIPTPSDGTCNKSMGRSDGCQCNNTYNCKSGNCVGGYCIPDFKGKVVGWGEGCPGGEGSVVSVCESACEVYRLYPVGGVVFEEVCNQSCKATGYEVCSEEKLVVTVKPTQKPTLIPTTKPILTSKLNPGEKCANNSQCVSGDCRNTGFNGVNRCSPFPDQTYCRNDNDCASGNCMKYGGDYKKCIAKLPDGAACNVNSNCVSNQCSDNLRGMKICASVLKPTQKQVQMSTIVPSQKPTNKPTQLPTAKPSVTQTVRSCNKILSRDNGCSCFSYMQCSSKNCVRRVCVPALTPTIVKTRTLTPTPVSINSKNIYDICSGVDFNNDGTVNSKDFILCFRANL